MGAFACRALDDRAHIVKIDPTDDGGDDDDDHDRPYLSDRGAIRQPAV